MTRCAVAFDEWAVAALMKKTGRLAMENCHQLHPDLLNLISQLRHIEEQLHAHRGEARENQPPFHAQRSEALVHREQPWWKRLGMGLQRVATQTSLHLLSGIVNENIERRAVHQPAGETVHAGMVRTHRRPTRRAFGVRRL